MPQNQKPRQMVDMDVVETSGVDHPAHGYEGWLVQKSASPASVSALTALLKEGASVPQKTKEDLLKEVGAAKLTPATRELMTKAIDITEDVNAAAELWQSLKSKLEAEDPETPSVEGQGTAAPATGAAAAPVVPGADLFKSVTDPLLKAALLEQQSELAKAREDFTKERDIRLDREATDMVKARFPQAAIDHEKLAKSVRHLDDAAREEVLKAMDGVYGQLDAASMFAELGSTQSKTSGAMAKAAALADGFMAAGVVKTHAEGVTKALTDNPALYTEYEQENR